MRDMLLTSNEFHIRIGSAWVAWGKMHVPLLSADRIGAFGGRQTV